MADYLLHLIPNGEAVGVFSAVSHYYLPETKQFEKRGLAIVREQQGTASVWEEWVDTLTSSSNPWTRFEVYSTENPGTLGDVLLEARSRSTYE